MRILQIFNYHIKIKKKLYFEKIRKIISGQNSFSQLIIKKNNNSSILTYYSLENSNLNLLNGNIKKRKK